MGGCNTSFLLGWPIQSFRCQFQGVYSIWWRNLGNKQHTNRTCFRGHYITNPMHCCKGNPYCKYVHVLFQWIFQQTLHTPDPQPTVYEGIPFILGGKGDAWGILQGYVGVLLDCLIPPKMGPLWRVSPCFRGTIPLLTCTDGCTVANHLRWLVYIPPQLPRFNRAFWWRGNISKKRKRSTKVNIDLKKNSKNKLKK